MNKRKKYIKQKMVILCAFILGILIAIYIKTLNPQKVYITLEEKKNLEHKIEIENKQIEKLRNIKLEYEKDLEAYEQKSLNRCAWRYFHADSCGRFVGRRHLR